MGWVGKNCLCDHEPAIKSPKGLLLPLLYPFPIPQFQFQNPLEKSQDCEQEMTSHRRVPISSSPDNAQKSRDSRRQCVESPLPEENNNDIIQFVAIWICGSVPARRTGERKESAGEVRTEPAVSGQASTAEHGFVLSFLILNSEQT